MLDIGNMRQPGRPCSSVGWVEARNPTNSLAQKQLTAGEDLFFFNRHFLFWVGIKLDKISHPLTAKIYPWLACPLHLMT